VVDTGDTKSGAGNIGPIHAASSLLFTANGAERKARRLALQSEMMRELTFEGLEAVNGAGVAEALNPFPRFSTENSTVKQTRSLTLPPTTEWSKNLH
jgi:hypothetical protein